MYYKVLITHSGSLPISGIPWHQHFVSNGMYDVILNHPLLSWDRDKYLKVLGGDFNRIRFFTILRDPAERFLSYYDWLEMKNKVGMGPGEFIRRSF